MATLFNILKITVGADKLCARVLVNPGMPLRTSEDIEATARVYYLAPAIAKHLCLGDTGREFQECMGDTELPHLLEHLSVEIMNETGLAGKVSCGRTRQVPGDERLFDVELSCPDDALTVGALSSAAFMMDWAFLHHEATSPDFAGTVSGLRKLVLNLRGEEDSEDTSEAPAADGEAEGLPADGEMASQGADAADVSVQMDERAPEPMPAPEPEPEPEPRRRREIDPMGIRRRAKTAEHAPAKRIADVFGSVFGGGSTSGGTDA
ncbi:hypothetical protein [Collinsella tanakaei]|uniref:hypothetical protein n=1 Tax=Collinsella tanakaei TaxID=626935 RepID=UPI001EF3FF1A|nr:hypothetical protein [Collinsella tanakaei]